MGSGTFNKWTGAVLSALLVLFGGRELINHFSHSSPPAKPGFEVAAMEEASGKVEPAVADTPDPPVAGLLKVADAGVGEGLVKACKACHSFDKGGANKIGPHLWGVVNRTLGAAEGFAYSASLKTKGGAWDYDALYQFLKNPKVYIQGTKMNYAGMRKPEDRAAVIAYLRNLADTPTPLP